MRKKINEISTFEVLLCMAVIMIHVLSECITGYRPDSFLAAAAFFISRVLTFAVPAFIMSSGIKMFVKFKTEKIDYMAFIKARILKIYLPYALWIMIYYLYFVFWRTYFPFKLSDLLKYIMTGEIAAPFYFIVTIMQFYILMPLWSYMVRRVKPALGIAAAAAITVAFSYFFRGIRYYDRIFVTYLMFWVIGCYAGVYYERFIGFLRRHKTVFAFFGILSAAAYTVMAYMEYRGIYGAYATELVKITFSLAAPLMLLGLITDKKISVVEKIAPATFYIYLIHCLIIFEVNNIMTVMAIHSVSLRLVVRCLMAYLISVAAAVGYVRLKGLRVKK